MVIIIFVSNVYIHNCEWMKLFSICKQCKLCIAQIVGVSVILQKVCISAEGVQEDHYNVKNYLVLLLHKKERGKMVTVNVRLEEHVSCTQLVIAWNCTIIIPTT